MKGKALRKQRLHGKTAASVLLKLFIGRFVATSPSTVVYFIRLNVSGKRHAQFVATVSSSLFPGSLSIIGTYYVKSIMEFISFEN